MPGLQEGTVAERDLLRRIASARALSDDLFRRVHTHALYDRPIPERHRIIFYIGHLEAFDWNLLHERVLGLKPFHPKFDRLFAFGIDPVGGGLPTDQASDWPSLEQLREYVTRTRLLLDENLAKGVSFSSLTDDLSFFLNVAIEHRSMHVETLAYMLHQLPVGRKISQSDPAEPECPSVTPEMVQVSAGEATLGLSRDGREFGWDNEFEAQTVEVPAFEIDRYKTTNQQYLEFMSAGGYANRSLWGDDDWRWVSSSGNSYPVFWRYADGQWRYRTMFGEIPLPMSWPVYVSHAEASAYARWIGKSLPTEAEWHRAAYGTPSGGERSYPWGDEAPDSSRGNFDLQRWNPVSVNAFPRGQSAFGVDGMLGNGWEWTSTAFAPFPGFKPFPFYPGYSANFFDGKHFVMKGGSARTARSMLRPTFRNWFQAQYQYVYAGFRCVSR
jgi:gamma-glutamyl hercynylcysteine S-oxide synthase